MTDWEKAADAADAFLVDAEPGSVVLRDPFDIFEDDQVFVFLRVPGSFDDQILVVRKDDLAVSLVADLVGQPDQYPNLVPLQASDDA